MKRRRKTRARVPNRSTDERKALGIHGCPFISWPVKEQQEYMDGLRRFYSEVIGAVLPDRRTALVGRILSGPATPAGTSTEPIG